MKGAHKPNSWIFVFDARPPLEIHPLLEVRAGAAVSLLMIEDGVSTSTPPFARFDSDVAGECDCGTSCLGWPSRQ